MLFLQLCVWKSFVILILDEEITQKFSSLILERFVKRLIFRQNKASKLNSFSK
jgi:hypothetical protein